MSRIVICGPAAAGKDVLKKRLGDKGFKLDVSYTSRPIRSGEVDGLDYHFLSESEFINKFYDMYESTKHGDYYYGTGLYEWENFDVFIMETHGISEITKEDRKNCFIIYLNIDDNIRKDRLKEIRGWNDQNIIHRFKMDNEKFSIFNDYDIEITNPNF